MVKTLITKTFDEFGELQAIFQSFFHQFSVFMELHMASHLPVSVSTASKASWFSYC